MYANARFFELVHGPVDGLLQFRWFGGWIVHWSCWSYSLRSHSRHHWRMTLGRMSARSLDLYQCVFMLSSGREVESDESDSSTRSFCKSRGLKIGQFSTRFSWKTKIRIYTGPLSYLFQWQPSNLIFSKWFVCPKIPWWIYVQVKLSTFILEFWADPGDPFRTGKKHRNGESVKEVWKHLKCTWDDQSPTYYDQEIFVHVRYRNLPKAIPFQSQTHMFLPFQSRKHLVLPFKHCHWTP